jgi:mannose-6-phosphate isomerase-like protein (cupin superfamily)
MRPVIDKSTVKHYTWGQDCTGWIFADTPGLSIKQELVPAGAREQWHYHNEASQFFYILKGQALFYCEDAEVSLSARQGVFVEPMQKHYIMNPGPEPLEFLVISQPSTNHDRINL